MVDCRAEESRTIGEAVGEFLANSLMSSARIVPASSHLFKPEKDSRSADSLLPNLAVVESTSNMAKARNDAVSDLHHGAGREAQLDSVQRRTADSIEKGILNGDLHTLQSTMNQFADRGHELIPIMLKVRQDMRPNKISIDFSVDTMNQARVRVGQYIGPYSLYLFTEPSQSMSATKLVIGGAGDGGGGGGGYYSNDQQVSPQTALKKIRDRDET